MVKNPVRKRNKQGVNKAQTRCKQGAGKERPRRCVNTPRPGPFAFTPDQNRVRGARVMHPTGFLCTATTCSDDYLASGALDGLLTGPHGPIHAGSWIRASENTSSRKLADNRPDADQSASGPWLVYRCGGLLGCPSGRRNFEAGSNTPRASIGRMISSGSSSKRNASSGGLWKSRSCPR